MRGKQLTDMATTQKINLSVLQRMDPDVVDVLVKAGHVTLYDFDTQTKTWARKQVEGALFVVQRCVETKQNDAKGDRCGSKGPNADRWIQPWVETGAGSRRQSSSSAYSTG